MQALTDLDVVNAAIQNLGINEALTAVDATTPNGLAALRHVGAGQRLLRRLLAAHPWSFAKAAAELRYSSDFVVSTDVTAGGNTTYSADFVLVASGLGDDSRDLVEWRVEEIGGSAVYLDGTLLATEATLEAPLSGYPEDNAQLVDQDVDWVAYESALSGIRLWLKSGSISGAGSGDGYDSHSFRLWRHDDWTYHYVPPSDMVAPRLIWPGGRAPDPRLEVPFEMQGNAQFAELVCTDVEEPTLEYTRLLAVTESVPEAFWDAYACALAAEMALPLRADAQIAQQARALAQQALAKAIAADLRAKHRDEPAPPKFITARL